MSAPDSGNRSIAALALCLAIVGAAAMLYYHLHIFIPNALESRATHGVRNGYFFGGDFYPIWLVARQSRGNRLDPYSPTMTREIQIGLFGRSFDAKDPSDPLFPYREFAYPAFTELLLAPTANLAFPSLRILLAVLLPMLTAASIWLWVLALRWRIGPLWFATLLLLALCTYPTLEAFFAEQPGLVVAFLLASSMLALRQNRFLMAGVLLSLTLIKPQMTLLAAFYLMLWSFADRSRLRLVVGFLVTMSLMIGVSLWIWPHWIGGWVRVLLGYHRYATPPLVWTLFGASVGQFVGIVAIICLLGLGLFLAWRNRQASVDSMAFWWTLSTLLAITSVTVLPGQAVYDHVILIPGIFLVLQYQHELRDQGPIPRTMLAVGSIALGWPWVAALGVIAVHSWLAPAQFASVLTLPIRTAAPLPFVVLALLFYAARIKPTGNQESS